MPLTNPSTPFDKDGWGDLITDVRKLFLMARGGSNDMNQASDDVNQQTDIQRVTVEVCTEQGEKTMIVMGTQPK